MQLTRTLMPYPTNKIVMIDVFDLVESEIFYTGDGRPPKEFSSIRDQVLACLSYKYEDCSEYFINHCMSNGVQHPALFVEDTDTAPGALYRSVNGHHRLAVAYVKNIPIPAVFGRHYNDIWDHDPNWNDIIVHSGQERA